MPPSTRRHLPETYFLAYFYYRTKPFSKRYNQYGFKSLREITDKYFDSVMSVQNYYNQPKYNNKSFAKRKDIFKKFVKDKSDEFYKSPNAVFPEEMERDPDKFGNWTELHEETENNWINHTNDELYDELKRHLSESLVDDVFENYISQPNYAQRSILIRQGQPEFRDGLYALYGKCMVTGCVDKQVLEACHIVPYSQSHDNSLENGLLLRADIHTLFDRKLIRINSDFSLTVSKEINSDEYKNLNLFVKFHSSLDVRKILSNLEQI